MLPQFLCIGAARSGTTWLYRRLLAQPGIDMPRVKDIEFFNRKYERGLAYYESFFRDCRSTNLVGEMTTSYFSDTVTPTRIKEHIPDARLIALLRNPADRAISNHWSLNERNKTITLEDRINSNSDFMASGFYFESLSRYLDFFPRENLFIGFFEDVQNQPLQLLDQVCGFLGVGEYVGRSGEDLYEKVNPAASKKYLGRSRLLYYTFRSLEMMHAFSASKRVERWNRKELPPVAPETRRYLVEAYRESNRKLGQLVGRDVSHWNNLREG